MGKWSYSNIEIQGDILDLNEFKKIAYKSELEEFCLKKIIPFPDNCVNEEDINQFNAEVFENSRGFYYSKLAHQDEEKLIYFCVSKNAGISLSSIAEKFNKLNFISINESEGYEYIEIIEYSHNIRKTNKILQNRKFNWRTPKSVFSFQRLEVLKFHYFTMLNRKPKIVEQIIDNEDYGLFPYDFFGIFPRIPFLKENEDFYKLIYNSSIQFNLPAPTNELESLFCSHLKMGYYWRIRYIDEFIVDQKVAKQLLQELFNDMFANADSTDSDFASALGYLYSNYDYPKVLHKISKKHILSRIQAIKLFKKNYKNYAKNISELKYCCQCYVERSRFLEDQQINPWPEIADIIELYDKENDFTDQFESEFDTNFYQQYEKLVSENSPNKKKLVNLFKKTLEVYRAMENECYPNMRKYNFEITLKTKLSIDGLRELARKSEVYDLIPELDNFYGEECDVPF